MPLPKINLARFKEKLGPLPVWAWGLIIGMVVVVIYFVFIKGKNDPVSDTIDDGGAAEAEANFEEADNAIAQGEDQNFWDAIKQFVAGLIPPATPTSSAPDVTPVESSGFGGYGGGGGGGGFSIAPASYAPPVVDLAGKQMGSSKQSVQTKPSPFAGLSGTGTVKVGLTDAGKILALGESVGIPSWSAPGLLIANEIQKTTPAPKPVAPAVAAPAVSAPAPAKAKATVKHTTTTPAKTGLVKGSSKGTLKKGL